MAVPFWISVALLNTVALTMTVTLLLAVAYVHTRLRKMMNVYKDVVKSCTALVSDQKMQESTLNRLCQKINITKEDIKREEKTHGSVAQDMAPESSLTDKFQPPTNQYDEAAPDDANYRTIMEDTTADVFTTKT